MGVAVAVGNVAVAVAVGELLEAKNIFLNKLLTSIAMRKQGKGYLWL
jgi:hypothetical protein